ncbi:MAG: hypothetical protein HYY16_00095 [Planctomycetes bacterium]|nr:hypothetical protein [Planctomycetota bacterium]
MAYRARAITSNAVTLRLPDLAWEPIISPETPFIPRSAGVPEETVRIPPALRPPFKIPIV